LIYFNSSNLAKHEEVDLLFQGYELSKLDFRVATLMSMDLEEVVRHKAAAIYKKARVPLFVEHGALSIDFLNQLPGPLVKPFWDHLEGRICDLLPPKKRTARIERMACFCDGKQRFVYRSEVEGRIASEIRGEGGYYWHKVFIPKGFQRTLGEMSVKERLKHGAGGALFQALRDAHGEKLG
jgi:XTP/dITP diphosphohydrolase